MVNTAQLRSRSIWSASAGHSWSYGTCSGVPHDFRTSGPSCPASRRSCLPTAYGEWCARGWWLASFTRSARREPRMPSPTVGVVSVSSWARWRCGAGRSWVRDRALGTRPADTR